ncbi:LysM peptidoglycan-binding and 3D domain-containing protein [Bacillus massiliigorillae]|uniref:LysM peptidoglycan-binding and 3D domain-containing protein n=1 Tax=Bacillus massiliigorillae TaxID=1243664 RepID=UPI0003A6427F|nr:3D domain-containing protein [Bacillus massiliigorillae]
MRKTIVSLIAAAAISTTVGINAHAEEVVVKQGDTLSELAQKYNVSVIDIKRANNLQSDLINVNQPLVISSEQHYTVVAGDSLWKIGQQFNVTVTDLQSWNNLTGDLIHPKQQLLIKESSSKQKSTSAPITSTNKVEEQQVEKSNDVATSPKPQQPVQQQVQKSVTKAAPVQEKSASQPKQETPASTATKTITVTATAYSETCDECTGITATGFNLKANPGAKVIAVDPNVIPLGSKVYVEGYGYATALDTGGAIKGNRIDVYIPNESEVNQWGVKQVKVQILD